MVMEIAPERALWSLRKETPDFSQGRNLRYSLARCAYPYRRMRAQPNSGGLLARQAAAVVEVLKYGHKKGGTF